MHGMLAKAKNNRTYRPVELYSKKYYAEKIKPAVDQELSEQGSSATNRLRVIRDATTKAFNNEDPEVQADIMQEIQRMKEQSQTVGLDIESEQRTPEQMQR